MAENIAKTARRQLGGRRLLFGEYLRSWTNLTYTIEDKLNILLILKRVSKQIVDVSALQLFGLITMTLFDYLYGIITKFQQSL